MEKYHTIDIIEAVYWLALLEVDGQNSAAYQLVSILRTMYSPGLQQTGPSKQAQEIIDLFDSI